MPIIGLRYTLISEIPCEAMSPALPASIISPFLTKTFPALTSSPAIMIFSPAVNERNIVTVSEVYSVSSYFVTASAPCGIIAPVRIFAAVPDSIGIIGASPARISCVIRSVAGTSSAMNANPS